MILRSLLFVPGDSERKLAKSESSRADALVLDLEDAVAADRIYVFLVLAHDRRRILHFNVTAYPTAEWTGQQLREAFPFDQLPRYLLRDRDAIFGNHFREQVRDLGISEVLLCTALALAACLYRASDRHHSTRVPRS